MTSDVKQELNVTLDQVQVARFLKTKGHSVRTISAILDSSPSTIQRWCETPADPSLLIPHIEAVENRTTLSDSCGNPLTIMNSEADFMRAYGKDLVRKHKGCDFRDPDTKELIEVKSYAVSSRQCVEMVQEFHEHKRRGILGSVQDDVVLIFRLENVLRIPTPEPECRAHPVSQIPVREIMPTPVTSQVGPLEILPTPNP